MIVAADGGERDIPTDSAIFATCGIPNEPGAFLNERLLTISARRCFWRNCRTCSPAIFRSCTRDGILAHVHGRGSSRRRRGADRAARIAAGQSDLSLVGGAYYGDRWDVLLTLSSAASLLSEKFAPVWDRGPAGGIAFGTMGAFWCSKPRARARPWRQAARADFGQVFSDRNARKGNEAETSLRREWDAIAPLVDREHAAIISGAAGLSLRPPQSFASSRTSAFRFAIPVRISGMGWIPSSWPTWLSAAA